MDIQIGTPMGDPTCPHGGHPQLCPICKGPAPLQPFTMGCICPPGANKECENPLCPRRNPFAVRT